MPEINLMEKYPKTKRNASERGIQKTAEDIAIAREYGKEFFDGDRRYGYGGYSYHPRFWTGVVEDMVKHYNLTNKSRILDIGCAKGFMLYDFKRVLPGAMIRGIDVSEYAIANAKEEIKQYLSIGNANDLGIFEDREFDLVISIATVHNLPIEECKKSLKEIQRIDKNAFITVDSWRDDEEGERMKNWILTAETYMSTKDWKELFKEVGYIGDYYWSLP